MKKITLFLLFSLYASINYAQTYQTFNNGGGDGQYNNPANWSNGVVPGPNDIIELDSNIETSPGDQITVGSIDNSADFYKIILNQNTSLIVTNQIGFLCEGCIEIFDQTRRFNDGKWHLVSSPITGNSYTPNLFDSNNGPGIEVLVLNTANTHRAMGTYSNTPDADGDWTYLSVSSGSQNHISGRGFSVKQPTNAVWGYLSNSTTGDYPSLPVNYGISIGQVNTADENPWNLVGNPFPSRVDIAQFLTDNAGVLKDTHQAVYVWNPDAGTDGKYEQLTTGSLEVGQGFFVSAKNATGDNVTFSAASRTHTSGTFYRNSAPNIKLLANDAHTQINFSETATNGLDPRFDVGTFGGQASNFKLFTELVANNEGVSFMQQAVPMSSLEEATIPVGVSTNETKEVAFKIEAANLPQGTYVYLEDKQTGTFTNLLETSYKVTVNANEASTGRFYLHTSAKALSTEAVSQDLANVSIFKSGVQTVSISGLQADKATVNVYSVLGKEVYSANVTPNGLTKVNLPNLATGIYVVNVTSALGKVSKKIVIE